MTTSCTAVATLVLYKRMSYSYTAELKCCHVNAVQLSVGEYSHTTPKDNVLVRKRACTRKARALR